MAKILTHKYFAILVLRDGKLNLQNYVAISYELRLQKEVQYYTKYDI